MEKEIIMADWKNVLDNLKPKDCKVCGNSFVPHSGVHKFCSEKCKGKWKYITGKESTENQYKKISGNWDRYFARLVNHHDRKKDGLTTEVLVDMVKDQDYKCALSGITLTCILEKGTKCKTNASIDRIEAGGPYVRENVQLVCRALNSWRTDTDLQEFIWWCKQVTNWQGSKE